MAVIHVDMVGYSRLIGLDDLGTLAQMHRLRAELIDREVELHGGHVHQTAGDSLLITFDSVNEAVACAIDIQQQVPELQPTQPPDRKIKFRIGIDLGDLIPDGNDLHGNSVNVAVRLQTACPAGDVCVSATVYNHVRTSVTVPAIALGPLKLKNIASPVEAFVLRTSRDLPEDTADMPAAATDEQTGPVSYRLPGLPPFRFRGPSIAVLPFRALSPREEDKYFAEGIVEDIVHTLAGQKELFVIARGSTMRYAGVNFDIADVARDLGVRYVLHGTVRRSGAGHRLRTELVDSSDLSVMRSDQYDARRSGLFSVLEKIAIEVATTIEPEVRERELRRAMRKPPNSITAYDLVLKALDRLYKINVAQSLEAQHLLQQAIMRDPDYAPAYTYMAYLLIFQVGEGWSKDPSADARAAAEFAGKAIERDPTDPVALAIYGHVHSFLLHDFDRATRSLDRAIEVGPSCALAWSMSSATCGYLGQARLAVERAERGLRHSPMDMRVFWPEAMLGQAYYVAGNYERAVSWARKAHEHSPATIFVMRTLAASLVANGQQEDARRVAQSLLQVQPDFRLATYVGNCPFHEPILTTWIERLRKAGLPE